ncbi:MAG: DUF3179 domain-containing protein [Hyphomicrobiaceae bacterium]
MLRPLKFTVLLAALMLPGATALQASPDRWRAEGWKTDFSQKTIEWPSVLSGGPPKDGIPSIDKPRFIATSAVTDLAPTEPVIGLTVNGEARAYPLRVLMWHEIVNDTLGGVPVAITYCPLCNAAIVFDRRHDGRVLDFGTTGKLRNSDLVMYDRQTESWWQQFTGEGIAGEFAGQSLKMLPSRLDAFARFVERNPDGQVLVPTNPGMRPYGRNPYTSYDSSVRPFLYNGALPEGIEPMARVIVVDGADGKPVAIEMAHLRARKELKMDGVELSWSPGQNSALDTDRISRGRDVGNVMAQRNGKDVRYDVTFAFVFHAFHPDGRIVKGDG